MLDAARQVKFNGAGRDLTDVLFEAQIQTGQLVCEYDENVLDVDLHDDELRAETELTALLMVAVNDAVDGDDDGPLPPAEVDRLLGLRS